MKMSLSVGCFLFILGIVGCDADMPPVDPGLLAPPASGEGLQYVMTSTVAPGQEIERCQFFVAPKGGYYVNHDQVRYTPGSHHVLLYLTDYSSIPTMDRSGHAHDISGVFDCQYGATADWKTTGVLSGAQSFAADSMINLPPGVAINVPEGAVLLMNTHYLNASQTALQSSSIINLYTIPKEQVQTEGEGILFYNPFIRVPALGQASARMRCPISSDVTLVTAQSHMHRRGVGYVANWIDESGATIEELYKNNQWENVPVKQWSPGKPLRGGTTLDYHCDYRNQEDRTILQGFSTKDEMCVLLGAYYPKSPDRGFANCSNPTWVGSGTKSGTDTLTCLQAAAGAADAMYGCIVDSCPTIAASLTAALGCQLSQGHGSCRSSCTNDPAQCQPCIAKACQAPLGALAAGQCS